MMPFLKHLNVFQEPLGINEPPHLVCFKIVLMCHCWSIYQKHLQFLKSFSFPEITFTCLCEKASFCCTRCLWAEKCPFCDLDWLGFATAFPPDRAGALTIVGPWNLTSVFPIARSVPVTVSLSSSYPSIPGGAKSLQPLSHYAYYVHRLGKHFYYINFFTFWGGVCSPGLVHVCGRLRTTGLLLTM